MDGVSSWSKILAFTDYSEFPIYDSRVAVALNIILSDAGPFSREFRFYMPPSASVTTLTCMWTIQEQWQSKNQRERNRYDWNNKTDYGKYRKYGHYLRLLDSLVSLRTLHDEERRRSAAQTLISDRLDAEMYIFSASKKIIEDYHKLIVQNGLSENVQQKLKSHYQNVQMYKIKRSLNTRKNT